MRTPLKIVVGIAFAAWSFGSVRAAGDGAVSGQAFGQTQEHQPVQIYTLRSASGIEARITNYGGIIVSLKVPDKNGHADDVVLGFDRLEDYLAPAYVKNKAYFGALIGRYANRIAGGRFTLDGHAYQIPTNNGANALHGGTRGFDQRVWQAHEPGGPQPVLELTYLSPDGEEGFPGNVSAKAVYTLEDNALRLEFTATTDRPTVINLTNHSYFNLKGAGNGDVLDHEVQIPADAYTPVDASSIPLPGGPASVAGTPFDFRQATRIGARIDAPDEQLKFGMGYDHNFVLSHEGSGGEPSMVAIVTEPTTGRVLTVSGDQPGVQFYSGNQLDGTLTGKGGEKYGKHAAFCLEPQHFPNSPNRPDFPSTVLRPGGTYRHTIIYRFTVAK